MRLLDVFGNVMFPLTFTSGLSRVLRSSGDGHRFMQDFINTSIIVHFPSCDKAINDALLKSASAVIIIITFMQLLFFWVVL